MPETDRMESASPPELRPEGSTFHRAVRTRLHVYLPSSATSRYLLPVPYCSGSFKAPSPLAVLSAIAQADTGSSLLCHFNEAELSSSRLR